MPPPRKRVKSELPDREEDGRKTPGTGESSGGNSSMRVQERLLQPQQGTIRRKYSSSPTPALIPCGSDAAGGSDQGGTAEKGGLQARYGHRRAANATLAGTSSTSEERRGASYGKATTSGSASIGGARGVKLEAITCKICLQPFTEPYTTMCGHTFCHVCITKQLQHCAKCPMCEEQLSPTTSSMQQQQQRKPMNSSGNGNGSCNRASSSMGLSSAAAQLIPNYAAAAMVEGILREEEALSPFNNNRRSLGTATSSSSSSPAQAFLSLSSIGEGHILHAIQSSRINLTSLLRIQQALRRRRGELEMGDQHLRRVLLREFFERALEKRQSEMERISNEMERLKSDSARLAALITASGDEEEEEDAVGGATPRLSGRPPSRGAGAVVPDHTGAAAAVALAEGSSVCSPTESRHLDGVAPRHRDRYHELSESLGDEFTRYRHRLGRHLASLESLYFGESTRRTELSEDGNFAAAAGERQKGTPSDGRDPRTETDSADNCLRTGACVDNSRESQQSLDSFSEVLQGLSCYSDMKRIASLNYNLENASPTPSIVSSIEFDREGEIFVIAGVTKKIKLYDYRSVVETASNLRSSPTAPFTSSAHYYYPLRQLDCASKISNVSWNSYERSLLASSDYDGAVQLWDAAVGKRVRAYCEHEKRCWTVQFNNIDPNLLASGGDDAKVKLWSTVAPESILNIDAKVNVCCVYFSPKSRNHMVFGSADHYVHLYDIRNASKPLNLFRGHRKAVSYVKYVNADEVISASTDSNLRLWDVNSGQCLTRLQGHHNERNFVGLSTNGQHVVCGSENNRLYLYHKRITEPLMSFSFATRQVRDFTSPLGGGLPSGDSNEAEEATAETEAFGGIRSAEGESSGGGGGSRQSTQQSSRSGASGGSNPPIIRTSTNAPSTTTTSSTASSPPSSTSDFVSAVCWKKNSNVVLAANSQGVVHVLEMR